MVKGLEPEIKLPKVIGFLARHCVPFANETHGDVAHSMSWTGGVKKLPDEDHRVCAWFGLQTHIDADAARPVEELSGGRQRASYSTGAGDCELSNTSEAISCVSTENKGNSWMAKLALTTSTDNASSPERL